MENEVRNKIAEALKKAILMFCLNSPPFDIQWFAIWIFHHVHLSHLSCRLSQISTEPYKCFVPRKEKDH